MLNTTGTLARCAMLLTQALYALNRVYFINDKHAPTNLTPSRAAWSALSSA